ncbi:MAG: PRTRC system ThiF family protein [Methylococcales bacterium]|jgi:sulfur-carrier protein adenylyltransferase/sulfurtransferase|nr:PRTRC system ThiF family protein [Methylococcales bacterium]
MEKNYFYCPEEWMNKPIRILVLGAGGTGSEVTENLIRTHFALINTGHEYGLDVTLMDADVVSESNIGRQRFAPCDVGQFKSAVLIHRANIAYGLDWRAINEYLTEETSLRSYDIVMGCVDKGHTRSIIKNSITSKDTLYMDFGNGRKTAQLIFGHVHGQGNNKLTLPNVMDFYPELEDMVEDDEPSCSLSESLSKQDLMINKVISSLGINLLWELLHEGKIKHHGYYVDLGKGIVNPIGIVG